MLHKKLSFKTQLIIRDIGAPGHSQNWDLYRGISRPDEILIDLDLETILSSDFKIFFEVYLKPLMDKGAELKHLRGN